MLINESISGRAIDAGTGVTSPTHMLDTRGVSSGTFMMMRRRNPATLAYRAIISRYVSVSAPPTSNTPCTSWPARAAATRKCSMLTIAIGWVGLSTHRGVTIAGRCSVRYRSISNDAEPLPMMMPARNSMTGTPVLASTLPTERRDSRCLLRFSSLAMPPRYTIRRTFARDAASANLRAIAASRSSNFAPVLIECSK